MQASSCRMGGGSVSSALRCPCLSPKLSRSPEILGRSSSARNAKKKKKKAVNAKYDNETAAKHRLQWSGKYLTLISKIHYRTVLHI